MINFTGEIRDYWNLSENVEERQKLNANDHVYEIGEEEHLRECWDTWINFVNKDKSLIWFFYNRYLLLL